MRISDNHYEFRKQLLQVHKPALRDFSLEPAANELVLEDGLILLVPKDAGVVTQKAARDFCEFMLESMSISAAVYVGDLPKGLEANQKLILIQAPDDGDDRAGFTIAVGKEIRLTGLTHRGIAQGLYWLEDLMSTRHAPFLKKGVKQYRCAFSHRTAYSAYSVDEYPDDYLSKLAHAGYTSIGLYYASGANMSIEGFRDYNTLIHRAATFGLDVDLYCHIPSKYHPEDPQAAEYYESTYGKMFQQCSGFRSLILVGENNEFPSKDPHTSGKLRTENFVDGIPTGKISPGWYPCYDYPLLIDIIKKSVHKYAPHVEIVFTSYNWNNQSTEVRVEFLKTLPKDITLLVDVELGQLIRYSSEAVGYCSDYSISKPGPGEYFRTEAAAAKELGIRLSCYSGTGGLTWDMGTIPYQPLPYSWMERYKALLDKNSGWDVSDLQEAIHFGVYPSFITDLAKRVFFEPDVPKEQAITDVLTKHFGAENVPGLKKAMRLWTRGSGYNTPAIEHQYGPDRIGPSYPLCLNRQILPPEPSYAAPSSWFFPAVYSPRNTGKCALSSVRMPWEQKRLAKMLKLFREGIEVARKECQQTPQIREVVGIMEFWANTVQTTLHVKEWYLLNQQFKIETDLKKIDFLIREMIRVAEAEIRNAEATIPLVRENSRLGFEASMEYRCDEPHLRWKINQVRYVLDVEIPEILRSRKLSE